MNTLTVIVIPDSLKYLDFTIDALRKQKNQNFSFIVTNPLGKYLLPYSNILTPEGINNQINTVVNTIKSRYYAVLMEGCVPCYEWTNNLINLTCSDKLHGIGGKVYLKSKQEIKLNKTEAYKLGYCDSSNLINYNNFTFSRKAFEEHGGFNANEDTLKYFLGQFLCPYVHYNYVDKLISCDGIERDNFYRLDLESTSKVKWLDTLNTQETIKKAKNKNLIITVAVNAFYKEMLSYTEDSVFRYANKIGADYIQIRNETQQWWGLEKFRIREYCKQYERILFLDCDIIINEDSPNIFDEVPKGYIGVYNDWIDNGDGTDKTNQWIKDEAEEMCYYQSVEYLDSEAYNSGVVVFDREHVDIWNPPTKPFIPKHCSEQHWFEQNIRRNNFPVHLLDKKWNNQYWTETFMDSGAYFDHYSGINREKRIGLLFQRFNKQFCKIQDGQLTKLSKKVIPVKRIRDNCLVTVVANGYEEIFSANIKSYLDYARKCNVDFHVITRNYHEDWPMGNKYLIENFTKEYDKTLYIDCDVWIKPESPNIYDITPDDKISLVNETRAVEKTEYQKHIKNQFEKIAESRGLLIDYPDLSYNCGVMVIPKSKSYLYTTPEFEFPAFWCFDQHNLLINLLQNNEEVFELNPKFNWEYITEDWENGLDSAWFIHLNGIKSSLKRLSLIEELKENYGI